MCRSTLLLLGFNCTGEGQGEISCVKTLEECEREAHHASNLGFDCLCLAPAAVLGQ